MGATKLVGPDAGVRKYDLLTALAVAGMAGTPTFCMSMTRLIALITARYNWRLAEVSIGQDELSRLWSVDPRTVKREIKRLREHKILTILRPGVRGRVATYRLDHDRIAELTCESWHRVGPDFEERMTPAGAFPEPAGQGPTVISFPGGAAVSASSAPDGVTDEWGRARALLAREVPAQDAAWFAPLMQARLADDTLILQAPNGFHANYVETHFCDLIERAVRQTSSEVKQVALISEDW